MAVLVSVATSHEIRGSTVAGYVRSWVHQNEKNAGRLGPIDLKGVFYSKSQDES